MRYVLLLIVISFIIGSCRKDEVFTSAPVTLNFSTDTVDFDTIFSLKDTNSLTTPKSITLRLIVSNPKDNAVKTNIELEGNLLSIFKALCIKLINIGLYNVMILLNSAIILTKDT